MRNAIVRRTVDQEVQWQDLAQACVLFAALGLPHEAQYASSPTTHNLTLSSGLLVFWPLSVFTIMEQVGEYSGFDQATRSQVDPKAGKRYAKLSRLQTSNNQHRPFP